MDQAPFTKMHEGEINYLNENTEHRIRQRDIPMVRTRQFLKSRRFLDIVVAVYSILFGIHFIILSNGDVINSYPLITPDGFDWYTEGVYLVKLLSGDAGLPPLHALRPPTFVMVTALDYLFGGAGFVLAFVSSAATFGTYYLVNKIIDFQYENVSGRWYAIPVVLATTVYPINYIKVYLLADPISVFFSLSASYFFIKYLRNNLTVNLFVSNTLFLIAGLTQTYGLIPLIVIYGLAFFIQLNQNKRKSITIILSGLFTTFLFVLLTYTWRSLIPHLTTPPNFDLLKLSVDMFGFYVGVWGYYLVPFLAYFLISRSVYLIKPSFDNVVGLGSVLIVLAFLLLLFFYQWPEARFTYYLWPWLLIAVFVNIGLKVDYRKSVLWLSVIVILACIITPSNYWQPTSSSLEVDPSRNWLFTYFHSKPIDREINRCTPTCENNKFLMQSDSYVNTVINVYNQIK